MIQLFTDLNSYSLISGVPLVKRLNSYEWIYVELEHFRSCFQKIRYISDKAKLFGLSRSRHICRHYIPSGKLWCALTTETFTASGNWTAPENDVEGFDVTSVRADVHAGGAGGGGSGNLSTTGCGGGGGGGYARANSFTTSPGTTYTITVGTAGTGATTDANGGDGGESWFDSSSSVRAAGGIGGGSAGSGGSGGGGGSGTHGDVTFNGGNGASRNGATNNSGGGGGGGAGSGANGASGTAQSGGTGGASDGGAGGSAGGTGGNGSVTNASPGSVIGGGGGGGGSLGGNGANGARGEIRITYARIFTRDNTDSRKFSFGSLRTYTKPPVTDSRKYDHCHLAPISFSDTWTGSDNDPWSSSLWDQSGSTGGTASIQNNRGRWFGTNSQGGKFKPVPNTNHRYCEILLSFIFQASTGGIFIHLLGNGIWESSGALATESYFLFLRRGANAYDIRRRQSGAAITLGTTPFTYTTGTLYKLRFQILRGTTDPNRLRARVWDAGGAEPSTWGIDAENDDILRSGTLMIGMEGGTAGGTSQDIDDLEFREETCIKRLVGRTSGDDRLLSDDDRRDIFRTVTDHRQLADVTIRDLSRLDQIQDERLLSDDVFRLSSRTFSDAAQFSDTVAIRDISRTQSDDRLIADDFVVRDLDRVHSDNREFSDDVTRRIGSRTHSDARVFGDNATFRDLSRIHSDDLLINDDDRRHVVRTRSDSRKFLDSPSMRDLSRINTDVRLFTDAVTRQLITRDHTDARQLADSLLRSLDRVSSDEHKTSDFTALRNFSKTISDDRQFAETITRALDRTFEDVRDYSIRSVADRKRLNFDGFETFKQLLISFGFMWADEDYAILLLHLLHMASGETQVVDTP